MKKLKFLLSFLALSMIFFCKPVKAAEAHVINLSELEDGQSLEITEDSILNLDTDKTLSKITITNCELTINGNGTLTIPSNESLSLSLDRCIGIRDSSISGKLIVNSGTIHSDIIGYGYLEINGGTLYSKINVNYITINDGSFFGKSISHLTNPDDAAININGGHIELTSEIRSRNLIISDNMFVAEPWNKAPVTDEPYDDDDDSPLLQRLCSNGHGVRIVPRSEVINVDGISLNESSCTLEVGESRQLFANITPENAWHKNVTWSSSDDSIAFVDQSGKVTAYRPGNTTITATTEDGELTATCEINIPSTKTYPDGLTIEISYFPNKSNQTQPYIKILYNGTVLKEGFDYTLNNKIDEVSYLSTTTITGLDDFLRKNN